MWIGTWADTEEEFLLVHTWQFKSLMWGISSSFPLADHFDLTGLQSLFGISQNHYMYVHGSLSQDGSYQKGIWVEDPFTYPPRSLFCTHVVQKVS